ncbi:MAG: enoyl-CoA hydratase-related protein [Gemmatimonadota bacterium]|nr:enoyl-CoA hydratase-related protein [Gemmatimonadota bacterium]MDH3424172.1 enoyl-CoA hydratase-related protein [Gemmatimonadota bacterium]
MSDTPVLVERREDHIAVLTLNRPEKLNALNGEVRRILREAFDELAGDDHVRAVVIHGAGEKAFVAGADITEFHTRTPDEQRAVYRERRIYETVADFPKPVIAALHGFCIGGGSELALACDVRVADRTTRISQAEIRIGLIPGGGGTQRLARLVGRGWASIISLTGDFVEADEAYRIGLVDVLVDEGEHLDRALELAGRMVRWSPVSLRLAKDAIRAAYELPLAEGIEYEKERFLDAFASEDGQEGVRAFVEKRKPDFKGR